MKVNQISNLNSIIYISNLNRIFKRRFFMNKKILTTFLFAATFFLLTGKPAQAQETNTNALQPYEEKLEELSSELGTELAIVPSENGTMEETIDFYTNMSIEDFESYVKDAYEEGELLDEITDAHLSEDFSSLEVAPLASIAYYQKYYYSAGNTKNYLYVRAYVNSDTSRYTGEVYDIGSIQNSYPSYKCKSASYSFSNNKKNLNCNYKVTKYLSNSLIETTTKTISCTYTANGGNIYASGKL